MKLGPKYNVNYMGGKCPLGYEYVESFERADGTTVNSFCQVKAPYPGQDKI